MPKNNAPRTGRDAGQGRANGQSVLPGFSIPDPAPKINPDSQTEKDRFIRRAQAVVLRRVLAGEETTADNVWSFAPVPDGLDHRAMGEAFGGLARIGVIVAVRHERSQRDERHGGFQQAWRVGDAKAARAYLSALIKSGDDAERPYHERA